ncbi:MAG TPA: TetR/AcrR family transcriptional regulator [Thermoleophilaceae bacterium]|jgi:AcrR family transcriptional regulator
MTDDDRTLRLSHELPRGRHNLPSEVVIRSQRERMIDAVIEVVAAKGYAAATVTDVVKAAGISRKTFYEQFADKDECFIAAYDEIIRYLFQWTSEAYAKPGPWASRVAAGLRVILDALASRPTLARFCVLEILAAGPRALARRDEVMRTFGDFFAPGVEEAPKGVRIPAAAADGVIGGIYSIVYDEILHERTRELPRLAPDLVYVALAPYVGPVAAARQAEIVKAAAADEAA